MNGGGSRLQRNLIQCALHTLPLAAPDGVSSCGRDEAAQNTRPRVECVPSGAPDTVVSSRQEAPCFGAAHPPGASCCPLRRGSASCRPAHRCGLTWRGFETANVGEIMTVARPSEGEDHLDSFHGGTFGTSALRKASGVV